MEGAGLGDAEVKGKYKHTSSGGHTTQQASGEIETHGTSAGATAKKEGEEGWKPTGGHVGPVHVGEELIE